MAGTTLLVGLALAAGARPGREVELVHCWTAGGEAAALHLLAAEMQKKRLAGKDSPIAGAAGARR